MRKYKSSITIEKCLKFQKASRSIQPVNKPICLDLSTHEVVMAGSKLMKTNGFVLSKDINYV